MCATCGCSTPARIGLPPVHDLGPDRGAGHAHHHPHPHDHADDHDHAGPLDHAGHHHRAHPLGHVHPHDGVHPSDLVQDRDDAHRDVHALAAEPAAPAARDGEDARERRWGDDSPLGPPGDDPGDGEAASAGRAAAVLRLERAVLARNDRLAGRNREWLAGRGVLALNLVSSPGAGKTTLLERMLRDLGREVPILVIEGDQETARDADRIHAAGGRALQINTGTVCHLDAAMVARALDRLAPSSGSLLVIENVGNLVCPALFDLGETARVVVASVPEGDDKPLKYPHIFRASDVMLLNKIDLLPHVPFDLDQCLAHARRVNPRLEVFPVSATRGDGLDAWYAWLRRHRTDGARAG
jgi:hydrogenase nickel incorporation protein HypB